MIDFFLDPVAEAVNRVEVGLLVPCKPNKVDISFQGLLYLSAGIQVVHVAIDDCLEHHLGVIRTAAALPIKFLEILEFESINHCADKAHGGIFRYIFIDTLRKKD